MSIIQIVGLALTATILAVILRQQKPEFAMMLSLMTGIIIILAVVNKVVTIFSTLETIAYRANVELLHLDTLLKVVGIAYIAEFGSQICRDAQENAIATKIEFAAKVIVMVMAIPIVVLILETVLQLLP